MWAAWRTLVKPTQFTKNTSASIPPQGTEKTCYILCISFIFAFFVFVVLNWFLIQIYVWLIFLNPLIYGRVCVQVPLPAGQLLQMDCLLHDWTEPPQECCFHQRQAMHVQSLSHWAPANIGPYSQTVRVRPSSPQQGSVIVQCWQVGNESSQKNLSVSFILFC